MNSNWSYLLGGYIFSLGLLGAYRAWIAMKHRTLEQERARFEKAGIRLEDEA